MAIGKQPKPKIFTPEWYVRVAENSGISLNTKITCANTECGKTIRFVKSTSFVCQACKTKLPYRVCYECHRLLPIAKFNVRSTGRMTSRCKSCAKTSRFDYCDPCLTHREFVDSVNKINMHIYFEIIRLTKNLKIKGFTTDDWLSTVKEYKGCCAKCGNEAELQKTFILPPVLGGKHEKWNIVPTCNRCYSEISRCRTRSVEHYISLVLLNNSYGTLTPARIYKYCLLDHILKEVHKLG